MIYDLYGIGNPIMDVLLKVEDETIDQLQLEKGEFNPITQNQLVDIETFIAAQEKKLSPGGSVANTIALFSQLGGKAFFCGKVGNDQVGRKYALAMKEIGVDTRFKPSLKTTGTAITFITPDAERTMAVHLGAALHLTPNDIDIDILSECKMLHLGGYVLEDPRLREAATFAMEYAFENNIPISIDCADPGVVMRNRDVIKYIIETYATVVFANDEEAKMLTGKDDPKEMIQELAKIANIAIVKCGKKGSLVAHENKIHEIEAHTITAQDSTGAGDAYAGAFLYAYMKGHSVKKAGELGSYIAAKIVEQIGARLEKLPKTTHIIGD